MTTRVRSSSDALSSILECLPEAAFVVDRQRRLRGANARFRARFPPGRKLIGVRCFELLHGRTRPCRAGDDGCPLDACLRGAARQSRVHLHALRDGWRREAALVRPIHDDAGAVVACLTTLRRAAPCAQHGAAAQSPRRTRQINPTPKSGAVGVRPADRVTPNMPRPDARPTSRPSQHGSS
jgi:PAS domain-containing protein